jgi:NAD(P)-dependent dehydrogenase (short-subunit alcohol dehydrogenase family)
MNGFSGVRVLITGAASGIGAAAARQLAEQGAELILMDQDAAGLAAFPGAQTIFGDVADPDLWRNADLSGLTHAVINAGIAYGGPPIADLDFAEWRRVLSTNLDGAFLSLSAAMRAIRAGGKGGGIVVSSSVAGIKAGPNIAPYATSKAALIHLTKVAALEGAPDRIRVNAIAPAGVETPIWTKQAFFKDLAAQKGSDDAAFTQLAGESVKLGRFAKADEAAAQILFLLSEAAATITGACLVADGGYSL